MQQSVRKPRKRKHYLPEWATAFGFLPKDLIEATGADKTVVSRWLGDSRSEPGPEYLEKLGEKFGVSPERFYAPPDDDAMRAKLLALFDQLDDDLRPVALSRIEALAGVALSPPQSAPPPKASRARR